MWSLTHKIKYLKRFVKKTHPALNVENEYYFYYYEKN